MSYRPCLSISCAGGGTYSSRSSVGNLKSPSDSRMKPGPSSFLGAERARSSKLGGSLGRTTSFSTMIGGATDATGRSMGVLMTGARAGTMAATSWVLSGNRRHGEPAATGRPGRHTPPPPPRPPPPTAARRGSRRGATCSADSSSSESNAGSSACEPWMRVSASSSTSLSARSIDSSDPSAQIVVVLEFDLVTAAAHAHRLALHRRQRRPGQRRRGHALDGAVVAVRSPAARRPAW